MRFSILLFCKTGIYMAEPVFVNVVGNNIYVQTLKKTTIYVIEG